MAVVRSLTSKEGDHGRATQFVKTGYAPQGAIQFPALGALVAHEFSRGPLDLPAFISIAPAGNGGTLGGGFLGPRFSPLVIGGGASNGNGQALAAAGALSAPDLKRPAEVSDAAQTARLDLVGSLNERFGATHGGVVVDGLQAAAESALRLMQPAAATAFRLEDESEELRANYGRSMFAQGCLLARRLIEHGVPFVEVTLGGWDTHQNNFQLVKDLSGTLDTALAALLTDLKGRRLLDDTLIVCMGEFGRTPTINRGNGRDHWPQSWAAVLAGGGIRGGQCIGKTTADGMAVEDRPVTVPDLIATVCNVVGIDPRKQNISNVSRPIRIADPAARPLEEI
jgi:uncharacterized protein (DUF1501 family)